MSKCNKKCLLNGKRNKTLNSNSIAYSIKHVFIAVSFTNTSAHTFSQKSTSTTPTPKRQHWEETNRKWKLMWFQLGVVFIWNSPYEKTKKLACFIRKLFRIMAYCFFSSSSFPSSFSFAGYTFTLKWMLYLFFSFQVKKRTKT